MRFHLVSLFHTQLTAEFSTNALNEKLRKFARMMKALGHTVYIYAGNITDAPCDELITCYTEEERADFVGDRHYTEVSWDTTHPTSQRFNRKVAEEILKRAEPHDFVCLSAGPAQKPIADALPDLVTVEYCVGYGGSFAKYRVFESYAWMHTVYGAETKGDVRNADGIWYDAVIPSFIDIDQFEFRSKKDDFYLFIGRILDRKGYHIAIDVCRELGKPLVLAGPGNPPANTRHVGVVGPEVRSHLMGRATAVFAPTIFLEPFGNVAIEAMACGTPVITTDWGGFTETVRQGVTGFRCRMFHEFVEAAEKAPSLSPRKIRKYAVANHSMEVVGEKYDAYFRRLSTIWDGGWYSRPR